MDKIIVEGGRHSLAGEVKISGAKNAALPMLISLASNRRHLYFTNVPDLMDIKSTSLLLSHLGATRRDPAEDTILHRCRRFGSIRSTL